MTANVSSFMNNGFKATTGMLNAYTSAGWTANQVQLSGARVYQVATSGALTANTLTTLINESGSAGFISQFAIMTNDVSNRTIRVKITVDGVSRYDFTSASISTSGYGCALAGILTTTSSESLPPIYYTNSIKIEYASSVTETGKFTTYLARTQVQ